MLGRAFNEKDLPDPGQYELFFPTSGEGTAKSYVEEKLKRKVVDKTDLALEAVPHITKEAMYRRFDLVEEMAKIIARIAVWNA